MTGPLTNLGVIRKARPVAIGANPFGLTGVSMQVSTLGSLTSITIDRRDVSHPLAGAAQQTGRHWTITPVGAGFTLELTLPHTLPAHTTAQACRLDGTSWDCARTASANGLVTRAGVTSLSDWAVGDNVVVTRAITGTVRDLNDTGVPGVTVVVTGTAQGRCQLL